MFLLFTDRGVALLKCGIIFAEQDCRHGVTIELSLRTMFLHHNICMGELYSKLMSQILI